MGQRFEMNAGGGAKLPLALAAFGLPVLALALRFMEHESWTVVEIAVGVGIVLAIYAAIWGSRMTGKAIELTDEGVVFPKVLSSEPETILWTGIEGIETGFDFTDGGSSGQRGWCDIIYYGGRRRRVQKGNVLGYDAFVRAVGTEIEKRKPKL